MDLSNTTINKVGDIIRSGKNNPEYNNAIKTLNVWRELHGPLLDEYYDKCTKLTKTDATKNIIVAQRLKRLPTIIGKLNRFKTMRLSSMQDIAGVRLIVRDMKQLMEVERKISKWKNLDRVKDYINTPKFDGYRGKHFIFKKDGMFVEIQLRTQIQHIWATSVETVDVFRNSSIKFGGDKTYWSDFFKQTSSVSAIAEGTNPVKLYSDKKISEICVLVNDTMTKYKIIQSLQAIEVAKQVSVDKHIKKDAYYLVLDLDFKQRVCHVFSFKEMEYDLAIQEYQLLENKFKHNNSVVLVAVNDIRKLNSAYPNYFLSLREFIELIKFILENYNKGD